MKILTFTLILPLFLLLAATAQASIRVNAAQQEAPAATGVLRMTNSVLGSDVYDTEGNRIAYIKDLVADRNGHIRTVILAYGGFIGLGRTMVALDFAAVANQGMDGEHLIAPLAKDDLRSAPPFSYEGIIGHDTSYNRSMNSEVAVDLDPSAQLSLAGLLGRTVIDPEGNPAGRVHDLSFRSGFIDTVTIVLDEEAQPIRRVSVFYKDLIILRRGSNLLFQWPGPEKL